MGEAHPLLTALAQKWQIALLLTFYWWEQVIMTTLVVRAAGKCSLCSLVTSPLYSERGARILWTAKHLRHRILSRHLGHGPRESNSFYVLRDYLEG